MGLLSALSSSPFDPLVDKATSEENTSEDWALIMDICDRVVVESTGAKECFRSILRRLNSPIPVVLMQCLTLTDALVSNCGKKFHLEVCSRDFESALRNLIGSKAHPKVSERARLLIKKWAKEFKNDPQLSLMPSLYEKLKKEGVSFSSSEPKRTRGLDPAVLKNPDAVSSAQEEADVLKAIELSLKETKGGSGSTGRMSLATSNSTVNNSSSNASLYPSFSLAESGAKSGGISSQQPAPAKEPIKVRALYDFEAAEDNELTFKSGEIILVLDNSDANWWKGSNHRGEGLFPTNFVSTDLDAEPEPVYKHEKKVQFNEEIKVKVLENEAGHAETNGTAPVTEIDESRIDRLLHLLHEADPQSAEQCDSEELLTLEEQCVAMMPLIDQQIELIDKRHASLTTLNSQLNSALNLYHDLMKESIMIDQAAAASAAAYAGMMPPQQVGQMPAYGYAHPGMTSQIEQPAPYHPNQMVAGQQQPYSPSAIGQQQQQYYVAQQQQPPAQTVGYQQPPPPQQMPYQADGSTPQPNGVQTGHPGHQPPQPVTSQQPVPAGVGQPPQGPYHPMYQSPSHAQHQPAPPTPQQQYQSPVPTSHVYGVSSPYSAEQHQQQVMHQQMMTSPHHMMLPPSTPTSGGVPSAVTNLGLL